MRNWKPIFVENSYIPRLLSIISPINIGAITLGFIVFSRGEMDVKTKQHETIHFQQFLETLFIGFFLLYFYDFLKGWVIYRDSKVAYYNTRAEREAYASENVGNYLKHRKRWEWLRR